MLRTLLFGTLFIFGSNHAFGQEQSRPIVPVSDQISTSYEHRLMRHIDYSPMDVWPVQGNPQLSDVRMFILGEEGGEDIGFPGDTFTEEQALRRMSRIYGYQGRLLQAQADGDAEAIEELLDTSMGALAILVDQPAVADNAQFRELYRSVVSEFERYYGFSDTLAIQQGDIFAVREQAFSAVNEGDLAPLEGVTLPRLSFADTEIPMTINERVKSSIVFLLKDPDRHINNWLSRAETYFPMVEKIFAEEGVPDELKYLAMIESGLNPNAKSWARAVGMWQFIRATGRAYDLESNGWVDERMNPEKATRAAAKHLRDLHRMFGDWQLALAGYNYSPGKLRRHIRRAEARLGRKATYWDVYDNLPRETRNYVPMFIATSIVASSPEDFGLGKGVQPGPNYEFDYVPVQGMLSLADAAKLAGTDLATIKALNPELRSSHLPPSKTAYYLRIPLYTYEQFAEGYRKLPASTKRAVSHHRVRSGETLGQIARRYGVSVSSLMRKNGLRSTVIRIGQSLVVPVTQYSSGLSNSEVSFADARPMRVQYGMRSVRPILPSQRTPLDKDLLIARAQELASKIPVVAASDKSTPEKKTVTKVSDKQPAVADANSKEAKKAEDKPSRIVYRVRRGDTLIKIAKQFKVSVSELRQWNNMSNSLIKIGQRLTVYPKASS
ncbi:MAG: LysM peptidoglycan-binding domain-containing protein [Bacteroidota bacterium]